MKTKIKEMFAKKPKKANSSSSWKKDLIELGLVVLVLFLLRSFIFGPLIVEGVSMHPTLESSDQGWVLKVGAIKRFDIINFHVPESVIEERPDQENHVYVKRVIGLPGDSVECRDDTLYINGKKVAEPYLDEAKSQWNNIKSFSRDYSMKTELGLDTIPANKYLVMGDNRPESYDGRSFGLIDKSEVIGVLKFRYWPFERLGTVD